MYASLLNRAVVRASWRLPCKPETLVGYLAATNLVDIPQPLNEFHLNDTHFNLWLQV